jgi:hypothetical protein
LNYFQGSIQLSQFAKTHQALADLEKNTSNQNFSPPLGQQRNGWKEGLIGISH